MTGTINNVSKLQNPWLLFAIAIALSMLMVWGIEQVVVERGFVRFQENLNRHAAHLADGKEKAVVLGSMIMMGGVNSSIRATAQGTLLPDNPEVMNLLKRLQQSFNLSNIRIVNSTGKVVAYFTPSGKSATGEVRSSRPYFIASMKGNPSMYAALGHTSGARGFYIAAPIFEKDAAINVTSLGFDETSGTTDPSTTPRTIGAVVAKIGFEEVDDLLKQESEALAVVSPEGVVFSSNVPAWRFRLLGRLEDIELVKKEQRVNEAFQKEPPRLLAVDQAGILLDEGKSLRMAQSSIDWKDPNGAWRLVGFADPSKSFGLIQRLSVGAGCFAFILLLGGWWQARRRVAERTAELQEANIHLETLSNTDGLTSLANRRHFDKVLSSEWSKTKRSGQPLALVMMDIDYFKKYNDHYGHQAGDTCLEKVAAVLTASARRVGDLAARYGGEEFTLVLPNTDITSALQLAEAARSAVESLKIPNELSPSGVVTASVGVAVMVSTPDAEVDALLLAADKALYRAKHDGRNCVVLAKDDVEQI